MKFPFRSPSLKSAKNREHAKALKQLVNEGKVDAREVNEAVEKLRAETGGRAAATMGPKYRSIYSNTLWAFATAAAATIGYGAGRTDFSSRDLPEHITTQPAQAKVIITPSCWTVTPVKNMYMLDGKYLELDDKTNLELFLLGLEGQCLTPSDANITGIQENSDASFEAK